MNRRDASAPIEKLAGLQRLAALERRRELEAALQETERQRERHDALGRQLDDADAALGAVYANERMCLDRLRLAAAIVEHSEDALAKGARDLADADAAERRAGTDWLLSRHRGDWFSDHARALRQREAARRDEAADGEARSLRLAVDQGRKGEKA